MIHNARDVLRNKIHSSAVQRSIVDSAATIEITRDERFGDLTTNAAMVWAKALGKNPREFAQELIQEWSFPDEVFCEATVAGPGFINLRMDKAVWGGMLQEILQSGIPFGHKLQGASGKRWLLEFVSANPTGPLNIVSARAAAIGDSLARILASQGHVADREFYVNDAGRQVRLFGESVRVRVAQSKGEAVEMPEEGYQGDYVVKLAEQAIAAGVDELSSEELGAWAVAQMVASQQAVMTKYGVDFQRWFHETELHRSHQVQKTLDELRSLGHIYEQDGAQFLRTTTDGIDDKDRVVITSAGHPTYLLPDIAYHHDKRNRGYDYAIDFLGPDHHGYIARMKSAMKLLGAPDDFLEIRLVQQVNLLREGKPVKMSKRAGEIVTLNDLLDELGGSTKAVDVARFFFLQRKVSTPLDFDLAIAEKETEENPAFYVQYAHARICSILRQEELQTAIGAVWQPELIALLQEPETKAVLRKLLEYPLVLERCVVALDPNAVTTYLTELAASFHKFYHHHRVIGQAPELTTARVKLLQAVRNVLADGLKMLGVSAPERM